MVAQPVAWMIDTMRGAPVVSDAPGSMLTALQTLLVDGWGALPATTVTVADGIATLEFASGTFAQYAVIEVTADAPAGLAGRYRVLDAPTANSCRIACGAAAGAYSSGIQVRYASAGGWARVFYDSARKIAAYRSTDMLGERKYFRVDDSGAVAAAVVGYASMTDIDTSIGAFPNGTGSQPAAMYLQRRYSGSGAVKYIAIADSRTAYVAACANPTYESAALCGFGDMAADGRQGFAAFVAGARTAAGSPYAGSVDGVGGTGRNLPLAQTPDGASMSYMVMPRPFAGSASLRSGVDTTFGAVVNTFNGQPWLSPRVVVDPTSGALVARVRGVFHVPQTVLSGVFARGDVIPVMINGEVRFAIAVLASSVDSLDAADAVSFVDITGPW